MTSINVITKRTKTNIKNYIQTGLLSSFLKSHKLMNSELPKITSWIQYFIKYTLISVNNQKKTKTNIKYYIQIGLFLSSFLKS